MAYRGRGRGHGAGFSVPFALVKNEDDKQGQSEGHAGPPPLYPVRPSANTTLIFLQT